MMRRIDSRGRAWRRRVRGRVALVGVALMLWNGSPLRAQLPTGGTVVSGAATISQDSAAMTITQTSPTVGVDWQTFDIGAGHRVTFLQPDAASLALNRVLGANASQIFGQLQANGRVFLLNSNGVLFAPGAQVAVGGLVASTLDLTEADAATGTYRLRNGGRAGAIVNDGEIQAGSVALIAPQITNRGAIRAPGGSVALAAGDAVTVSLLGNGLLTAQIDEAALTAAIQNHGTIAADGGRVQLLADAVRDSVINTDGIIQARSLVQADGRIYLSGGANGTVTVSGTLDTSGTDAGARGGAITALGRQVGLLAGATVNASGAAGGGTVLVGGNWQGAGPELNADATYMDAAATIRADATGAGDGGTVVLWSEQYTGFYGAISARGGAQGGDGGRVETSSHDNLQALGSVDAAGPAGAAGQWLLDPFNVTIAAATANVSQAGGVFTATGTPATIDVATINAALNAGTAVTVDTGSSGAEAGDITVTSAIAKTAGAATSLTLNAAGSIALNANITSVGQLATTLNAAGGAVSGTGAINTNGGLLTLNAASGSGTLSGVISGSGGLTKTGAGTTILSVNNTYSGPTTINAGILQIGAGATTGTLGTSAATVNAGGTLRWFRSNALTITNSMSGTGTVEFLGTGLSGASDYVLGANNSGLTGSVIVDRARLRYDNANDLGAAAVITVLSGGQLWAQANIGNLLNLNGIGWNESNSRFGALRLGNGATHATASGNINLQSDSRITASTSTGTVSGVISGSSALEVGGGQSTGGGPGTLTLSGANTFTGRLTIRHGTTSIDTATLILAPTGSLATTDVRIGTAAASGAPMNSFAVLQTQGTNQLPNAVVSFDGLAPLSRWAYWQLLGTSQSVAGINDTSAQGVIENTENLPGFGNATLTLTGSGSYSFNGTMRDKFSGTSGTLSLVKDGTGTQTLSGSSMTYTGATIVNGGRLVLSDAFGTDGIAGYRSATTVNNGATLELAGIANAEHPAGFLLALNDGSTLSKTSTGYSSFFRSNVTVGGTVTIRVSNSGNNNQLFIGSTTTGLAGAGTINLTNTDTDTSAATVPGLTLRGPGSFSGAVNVSGGGLNIGLFSGSTSAHLALQNVDLSLTDSARLNLAGAFAANATAASVKSLAGDSTATVTLGAQTLTLGTNNGTGGDFAGVISGTGPLVKTGTGTQTLSGGNTYAGTTTISGGTLRIGNGSTTGTLGTGAVTNNATLAFNRSNTVTVANTTSGTGTLSATIGGDLTLNGAINLGGTVTTTSGGSTTIGGTLTAGGAVAIASAANTAINAALTSTGSTVTLTAGSDDLVAATSVANGSVTGGDVTLNAAVQAGSGVTIYSGNATTSAYTARITGSSNSLNKAYATAPGAGTVDGAKVLNAFYRVSPVLTVSGVTVATKVYDKTTAAILNTSGATVNGVIDGDSVTLQSSTGTFATSHAGTGLTVNLTHTVANTPPAGVTVGGYTVSASTTTGTITPAPLTVTAATNTKVYDGTTSAAATPTVTAGALVGGDSFATLMEAYASRNAGTGLTLTPTVVINDGNSGQNYAVTLVANTSGVITARAITVTAVTNSKVYDGTTNATGVPSITAGSLAVGDTAGFVEAYSTKDVGTGLTLTPSGAVIDGNGGANYAVTFVSDGTGEIRPLAIQVAVAVAGGRVYDGTTAAPASLLQVSNNVDGSNLVLSGTGTLAGANAGFQPLLSSGGNLQGFTLSGAAAGNYTLFGGSGTIIVSPRPVTLVGNRVYDGTADIDGSLLTVTDAIAGDTVTVTGGSGTLASRHVGAQGIAEAGTLTLSNRNYTVAAGRGAITINPRAITVTAVAHNKVYDGTIDAAVTPQITGGALAAGDTSGFVQTYSSKNAGTGLTLTPSGTVSDGNGGRNYTLTLVSGNEGVITPAPLALVPLAVSRPYTGWPVELAAYSGGLANYTVTGLAPGDALASLGLSLTGALSVNGGTTALDPGAYVFGPGTLAPRLTNGNYTIAFSNPAEHALTILAPDATPMPAPEATPDLITAGMIAASNAATIRAATAIRTEATLGAEMPASSPGGRTGPTVSTCLLINGGLRLPAGVVAESQSARACAAN